MRIQGVSHAANRIRPALAHALAWRVFTELVRRHRPSVDLRVHVVYGVDDPWGRLEITARGGGLPDGIIVLHLAEGLRGAWLVRPFAADHMPALVNWPEANWLLALLGPQDPSEVIDLFTMMSGLPAVTEAGPSTAPVLVARVIAELLAQRSLGRECWRASCAFYLDSGSAGCARWAAQDPWVDSQLPTAPEDLGGTPERFWLIHREGAEPGPADELSAIVGGCLALDFKTGRVWVPGKSGELWLLDLYERSGRRLEELVRTIQPLLD